MSKGFASNNRMVVLAAGIVCCFGGVAVRLVDLHVWQRAELLKFVVVQLEPKCQIEPTGAFD